MSTAIEEHVNSTGVDNKKLMMWIFLGSDCLFFGSFISTYLVYRNRSLAGPYPNEILDIPITTVSTFVLLMSSLAMVLAFITSLTFCSVDFWLKLVQLNLK